MDLVGIIKSQVRHDRHTRRLLDDVRMQVGRLQELVFDDAIRRRSELLQEKTMTSKNRGIIEDSICGEEVIVSLTSFGSRINEVYLAVESIMQGTIKPNRIILWLSRDEFYGRTLPSTLQKQVNRGLQIEYCEDIRSYKKILPTMKRYPDACVVTIDDDLMYEFDLLENLLEKHKEYPYDICSCRMHAIKADKDGRPISYLKWDKEISPESVSNTHFLTSGAGTLFPPHCFTADFYDKDKFMELSPYADDVWINAMSMLSGRHIRKAYTHSVKGCDYLPIRLDQDDALSTENTSPIICRNDEQIKKVFDYFDLYHFLIV